MHAFAEVVAEPLDTGGHPDAGGARELTSIGISSGPVFNEEVDFRADSGAPEVYPRLLPPVPQGAADLRQNGGLEQRASERSFRRVAQIPQARQEAERAGVREVDLSGS